MPPTGKKFTDAELLGGEDDDNDGLNGADALDALDEGRDERDDDLSGLKALDADDDKGKARADDDDFEVVVVDKDEGRDAERNARADDADADAGALDDEDAGEVVDDTSQPRDFLTEWEKNNFSKAMQNRVNRERRVAQRERDRAEQASATNRKLAVENHELQQVLASTMAKNLESQIRDKQGLLKKAKEDGATDDEIKLQGELDDLRATKRDVDATVERLGKVKPEDVVRQLDDQSGGNKLPPETQRWLGRNRWINNQQFGAQALVAQAIDKSLAKEYAAGRFRHAPGTTSYFTELDRRIHENLPALRSQIRQAYGEPRRGDQAPRTAPASRSTTTTAAARSGSNKVELTRADLQNMQEFGLDPKNPKHLKEYARNKRTGVANV